MDILRFSADKIWEWLGRTPPELTALSVRCALILGLCIVFGQAVKAIAQAKGLLNTLPLQILAFVLAFVTGLTVSLSRIQELGGNSKSVLQLAALLGCLLLPYVSVRFLIRRKGVQDIAWKIVYAVEFLLLAVQIIVLWAR